jgi:hypothetical protein
MKHKSVNKELSTYENEIKHEIFKTSLKKNQFLMEIKNGLGAEIKKNPNQVKIIKKTWSQKIKAFLLKIFTKF